MLLSSNFLLLSSQQKEGIGSLLAMVLLALFVVIVLVVGIRVKTKSQQEQAKESVQLKEIPHKEGSEVSSKKALM